MIVVIWAALRTRSIICVSAFLRSAWLDCWKMTYFHFVWHQSPTVHQSWETLVILMYLIVFAATLFLVTIRLRSGTENLRLPDLYPSYTTSILKDFCDVTYGRKICWALSSKVSAPISFRRCTITPIKYSVVYFWSMRAFGSRIHFSRQENMSDFVCDLISPNFWEGCFIWRTNWYRYRSWSTIWHDI